MINIRKNYLEQFLFVNAGDTGVNLPGKQTTSSPQKRIPLSIILWRIDDLLRHPSTVNNKSFPSHNSSKRYYKWIPPNGGVYLHQPCFTDTIYADDNFITIL